MDVDVSTSAQPTLTLSRKGSDAGSENQSDQSDQNTDSQVWVDSEILGENDLSLTYLPLKQEEERIKRLTTRERVINELLTTEHDFVVCRIQMFLNYLKGL